MNNFEFRFTEDIILKVNGDTKLRLIGNSNVPFYKLPCTLWLFEKQITGNNCFHDYSATHYENITSDNSQIFYAIKKMILPEIKNLPVNEDAFNELLMQTGLCNLNTSDNKNIFLDNNAAVIKDTSGVIDYSKSIKYWGAEISKYTISDIVEMNKAYRTSVLKTGNELTRQIYDEIAYQINLHS